MHWGWRCATPNELPNAGPGDVPKRSSPGLGQRCALMSLCHFCFAVCGKTGCIDKRAVAMQCNVNLHRWDAGLGDAP